ncbi:MAG TPA: hypothetical protein VFJ74_11470 [Gemmatimonadaceae bacterium]|nr:hypothetical protein [Gemmatimonadaceae bacterium]
MPFPGRLRHLDRPSRVGLLVALVSAAAACSDGVASGAGAVRASFTTNGVDRDVNGYQLAIDHGTPVSVASNGFFVFDGLSVGRHTLAVAGVQRNCTLDGGASRGVVVRSGDTTEVAPTVACVADPGTLAQSATDPVADTLDNADTSVPPALDVIATSVRYKSDSIIVMMRFRSPIVPIDAGADNSLYGLVWIDADENQATGTLPYVDYYGGSTNMGADFEIDLLQATATSAPMFDIVNGGASRVALTFGGDSVTMRFTRAQLGVGDEGNFSWAALIGTWAGPSDIAPNAGSYVAHDPDLATATRVVANAAAATPRLRGRLAGSATRPPHAWEMLRRPTR